MAASTYQAERLDDLSSSSLEEARKRWEGTLAPSELQARAVTEGPLRLRAQVEGLRATGEATSAEIWTLRAEAYGSSAADRLAQLDRQRTEWNERLETYREQSFDRNHWVEL